MKKLLATGLLLFAVLAAHGQMAKFYFSNKYNQAEEFEEYDFEWRINGQPIKSIDDTVWIQPDPMRWDTILFTNNLQKHWDTVICNIALPNTYHFYINDCCMGFYVYNETLSKLPQGKVKFRLKQKAQRLFLGRLGETAVVLDDKEEKEVTPLCRSAMASNIYWVQLQKINICNDRPCESDGTICFKKENGEPEFSFNYEVSETLLRFLYMPLEDKPLRVSYKPENGKLKVK